MAKKSIDGSFFSIIYDREEKEQVTNPNIASYWAFWSVFRLDFDDKCRWNSSRVYQESLTTCQQLTKQVTIESFQVLNSNTIEISLETSLSTCVEVHSIWSKFSENGTCKFCHQSLWMHSHSHWHRCSYEQFRRESKRTFVLHHSWFREKNG